MSQHFDFVQTERNVWPFEVLVCRGCDQIGIMRFKRLKDAKIASEPLTFEGYTCICDKDGVEKFRTSPQQTRAWQRMVLK